MLVCQSFDSNNFYSPRSKEELFEWNNKNIPNAISNKINGVDEMIIHSFNKDTFMLNRLKSQIITIKKFGPTNIHRKTFQPIKDMIKKLR